MPHILDTTVVVTWILAVNGSPPVEADYDVLISKPDGTTEYIESGLTSHTAPTATEQGEGTYDALVDQLGLWVFQLNDGTSASFTAYSTHEIYVVDPDDPAIDTTYVTFLDPTIHDLGT